MKVDSAPKLQNSVKVHLLPKRAIQQPEQIKSATANFNANDFDPGLTGTNIRIFGETICLL
jgi:hypothetical protein